MLLICEAELLDGQRVDVRIYHGRIVEIGARLARYGETVIDAAGGLLLPGLHDHHVHVCAMAAAMASIRCGPPDIKDEEALTAVLGAPGDGWLRGIGYHESITNCLVDRHWLDQIAPNRPVRMQHRSGRLWIFNSAGLERLLGAGLPLPKGLECEARQWTGRLFDEDVWLRRALRGAAPSLGSVGHAFARYGVTGITDMSPANDNAMAAHFAYENARGALPQRVLLAGRPELGDHGLNAAITLGPVKLHLHEAKLPQFDAMVAAIGAAHEKGRAVAVHCVTEVELVFTLAAIREAGACLGDRIEHASVTPDTLLEEIARLRLAVVTQPHFVAERGDAYLTDIPEVEWKHLYRLGAFLAAGVSLGGGSDTPFGAVDPWAAMASAVSRRTNSGRLLDEHEALTPEKALALFLADPADLGHTRSVAVGSRADLCLLTRSWHDVRQNLSAGFVRATVIDGRLVHDIVDQPPLQRNLYADAFAR